MKKEELNNLPEDFWDDIDGGTNEEEEDFWDDYWYYTEDCDGCGCNDPDDIYDDEEYWDDDYVIREIIREKRLKKIEKIFKI